jgi:predicted Zn-dependent peptidase
MGTKGENVPAAAEGLRKEIERLGSTPPTEKELLRAQNDLLREKLMRQLTRMGQAYVTSVTAFENEPLRPPEQIVAALKSVELSDVHRVTQSHLRGASWVTVVGK